MDKKKRKIKRRTIVIVIICLTAICTVFIQISSRNYHFRVHQHLEAQITDSDIENPLSCLKDTDQASHAADYGAVDVSKLKTHLPIVLIETGEDIPGVPYHEAGNSHREYTTSFTGEDFTVGNIKIIDNVKSSNQIDDEPAVVTNAKINVRGNTSRWFDKKSYAVKFVDAELNNKNLGVMGMESNNDWVLHGPFMDKTLMRNYFAMNISGELMDYAPDVRYCEVIKNGEYQGVYVMMETVSRGKGRIDIEKANDTKNITGYIIGLENQSTVQITALDNFTKYVSALRKHAYFDVTYPGTTLLTDSLKEYIEKDVSKFEKALYSYDYDKPKYGFWNYADVGEFIDYFILMEVFLQHDTGNLSTYFYKDVNGLYKPCVWDFNNCLDNVIEVAKDDFYVRKFVTVQAPWFWMMIKEESFTDKLIARYHSLRDGILADEYLNNYIDEVRTYLGSAIDRNYAVWGYSYDSDNADFRNRPHPDDKNPGNYEEAVGQMKEALLERLHWLDKHIEVLAQYSHESAVKKFND